MEIRRLQQRRRPATLVIQVTDRVVVVMKAAPIHDIRHVENGDNHK